MSVRLHFVVEGQTEETFVNRTLVPHLAGFSVWADVRCVMTRKKRAAIFRGGLNSYVMARKDLRLWMAEEHQHECWFTTMFDLYRLPADFPGCETARKVPNPRERVKLLEEAFEADVDHPRFVPYIQLHEFEALVLADVSRLSFLFDGREAEVERLVEMAGAHESPELINDGVATAPSKRIIAEIPEYDGAKPVAGPLVVADIGLPALREKCPHFNDWLSSLEAIGNPPAAIPPVP